MTSTPPRRHPPAVYRRRRLVVLLVLIALAILVWALVARPWAGPASGAGESAGLPDAVAPGPTVTALPVPDNADPSPSPSASTPAKPAPTPAPSGTPAVAVCAAGDLVVEPLTDQTSYPKGKNPQLSIALTNIGDADCTINVGTSTQKFVITSGTDTWWRSTDCQTAPSDQIVLLGAGQRVTSATPLVWDRTRSSVGTCKDTSRPVAPGGGASYHLSVTIGGVTSDDTAQFLLY